MSDGGAVTAQYVELSASARVASVPLGHLSIELGHLYMEDFAAGPDRLAEPVVVTGPHAQTWAEQPPVTQLTVRPAPFSAYRTFSVLAGRFMPIELAVRTILSQYAVEPAVAEQVTGRADAEKLVLPASIVDRIEYAFAGTGWR